MAIVLTTFGEEGHCKPVEKKLKCFGCVFWDYSGFSSSVLRITEHKEHQIPNEHREQQNERKTIPFSPITERTPKQQEIPSITSTVRPLLSGQPRDFEKLPLNRGWPLKRVCI